METNIVVKSEQSISSRIRVRTDLLESKTRDNDFPCDSPQSEDKSEPYGFHDQSSSRSLILSILDNALDTAVRPVDPYISEISLPETSLSSSSLSRRMKTGSTEVSEYSSEEFALPDYADDVKELTEDDDITVLKVQPMKEPMRAQVKQQSLKKQAGVQSKRAKRRERRALEKIIKKNLKTNRVWLRKQTVRLPIETLVRLQEAQKKKIDDIAKTLSFPICQTSTEDNRRTSPLPSSTSTCNSSSTSSLPSSSSISLPPPDNIETRIPDQGISEPAEPVRKVVWRSVPVPKPISVVCAERDNTRKITNLETTRNNQNHIVIFDESYKWKSQAVNTSTTSKKQCLNPSTSRLAQPDIPQTSREQYHRTASIAADTTVDSNLSESQISMDRMICKNTTPTGAAIRHLVIGHSQILGCWEHVFEEEMLNFDVDWMCLPGAKAYQLIDIVNDEMRESQIPLRISAMVWQNSIVTITLSEVQMLLEKVEDTLRKFPQHRVALPECQYVPAQSDYFQHIAKVNIMLADFNERHGFQRYPLFKTIMKYNKKNRLYRVKQQEWSEFLDKTGPGCTIANKNKYTEFIRKFHLYNLAEAEEVPWQPSVLSPFKIQDVICPQNKMIDPTEIPSETITVTVQNPVEKDARSVADITSFVQTIRKSSESRTSSDSFVIRKLSESNTTTDSSLQDDVNHLLSSNLLETTLSCKTTEDRRNELVRFRDCMVELAIKHRIPWSRLAEMSSSRADPAETVNRRSTRMEEVIKSEEERDRLAKKRRVLVEKSCFFIGIEEVTDSDSEVEVLDFIPGSPRAPTRNTRASQHEPEPSSRVFRDQEVQFGKPLPSHELEEHYQPHVAVLSGFNSDQAYHNNKYTEIDGNAGQFLGDVRFEDTYTSNQRHENTIDEDNIRGNRSVFSRLGSKASNLRREKERRCSRERAVKRSITGSLEIQTKGNGSNYGPVSLELPKPVMSRRRHDHDPQERKEEGRQYRDRSSRRRAHDDQDSQELHLGSRRHPQESRGQYLEGIRVSHVSQGNQPTEDFHPHYQQIQRYREGSCEQDQEYDRQPGRDPHRDPNDHGYQVAQDSGEGRHVSQDSFGDDRGHNRSKTERQTVRLRWNDPSASELGLSGSSTRDSRHPDDSSIYDEIESKNRELELLREEKQRMKEELRERVSEPMEQKQRMKEELRERESELMEQKQRMKEELRERERVFMEDLYGQARVSPVPDFSGELSLLPDQRVSDNQYFLAQSETKYRGIQETGLATAQLVCTPCQFTGNSVIHYNSHMSGKKHQKVLLLHNEQVRRKNSSARLKAPKMTSEDVQLVCEPCGVTAGSQVAMDMHLAGIKHKFYFPS